MKTLLLLMPDAVTATTIATAFDGYKVLTASTAGEAIALESSFDAVVMELSLAGHSGFEFLYEFRSYADWSDIPVIIYSRIRLSDETLQSRAFTSLKARYAYQPEVSLAGLRNMVEKEIHSQ